MVTLVWLKIWVPPRDNRLNSDPQWDSLGGDPSVTQKVQPCDLRVLTPARVKSKKSDASILLWRGYLWSDACVERRRGAIRRSCSQRETRCLVFDNKNPTRQCRDLTATHLPNPWTWIPSRWDFVLLCFFKGETTFVLIWVFRIYTQETCLVGYWVWPPHYLPEQTSLISKYKYGMLST